MVFSSASSLHRRVSKNDGLRRTAVLRGRMTTQALQVGPTILGARLPKLVRVRDSSVQHPPIRDAGEFYSGLDQRRYSSD
jgi:hypothetical protein